ncbi:MAG: hypothetical protein IJA94_05735 [Bacilli bacterium]|nr:hypothetical protein [Bacilli bacterium]
MLYILYIIYGIIGGLAGYLFSSSITLLLLFNNIFNTEIVYDKNLLIFINLGIVLGFIIIYLKKFFNKIKILLKIKINNKDKKKKKKEKLKKNNKAILITNVIYFISFIILKKYTLRALNPKIIGLYFIISGILLFLIKKKNGSKEEKDMRFKTIIFIIIANIISNLFSFNNLIVTLFICLLSNFKLTVALKYSFCIYTTSLIGFIILNVNNLLTTFTLYYLPCYVIALLTAFITSIYYSKSFKERLAKKQFQYFIIVNLMLGIITLFYFR